MPDKRSINDDLHHLVAAVKQHLDKINAITERRKIKV